jgi:pimeloyl-ACP methyl ester carboxylesterase
MVDALAQEQPGIGSGMLGVTLGIGSSIGTAIAAAYQSAHPIDATARVRGVTATQPIPPVFGDRGYTYRRDRPLIRRSRPVGPRHRDRDPTCGNVSRLTLALGARWPRNAELRCARAPRSSPVAFRGGFRGDALRSDTY